MISVNESGKRRILAVSAAAFACLLVLPLLPSGFGAGSVNIDAAFARHGADDGPDDDGHHNGRHQRHGNDDGRNHDKNDDHGGRRPGHK